uniref:Uncharacterized protein n=1 Tax=Rhizophora mucronata TaxID=61149 RepID=A0A2P2Q807_RHIMU
MMKWIVSLVVDLVPVRLAASPVLFSLNLCISSCPDAENKLEDSEFNHQGNVEFWSS